MAYYDRMLGQGTVHLWFVFQDEIRDERLLGRYRELMTDEERKKELRFYFERDRRQYVITRALVRTVLSESTGGRVDPRDWRFVANAYGRPEIAAPVLSTPMSFNLAHTEGLIVCACSTSSMGLGVDVERVTPERAYLEAADRFFSPSEVAELRSLPSPQQAEKFFHFWTLKESYIKAVGAGLSIPLDQFAFSLARPGHLTLSINRSLADDPARWSFWLMQPAPAFVAALCAERIHTHAPRRICRKAVPLVSSDLLESAFIAIR